MRSAAVAFILSIVCGTILTPLVRRLAHRIGALDQALSSRKIHGRPIPRLGGVAIVLAFYAPLVGLLLFHSGVSEMFLAEKQKVCPVTGEPLDSMGGPVRVEVAGRTVFICCKACEKPLRRDPAKYLAKLPPK